MGSWLALEPNLLVMVWCTLVLLPGVKLGVVAESIEPCPGRRPILATAAFQLCNMAHDYVYIVTFRER